MMSKNLLIFQPPNHKINLSLQHNLQTYFLQLTGQINASKLNLRIPQKLYSKIMIFVVKERPNSIFGNFHLIEKGF